jgi:pyroglutamyl-peptidase
MPRGVHRLGGMTRVLLTGFEPFAGAPVNPSWDAVELVDATWRGDASLVVCRLPVEFGRAASELLAAVEAHSPDVIIAVGVADGRTGITVERVAINLDDAIIPDTIGAQPIDVEIVPGATTALWSTLPVKAIVNEIRAADLPASVSLSAGAFVCNHVFYALQHALVGRTARSGFIHVPATPEMNLGPSVPTMTVAQLASALAIAIDVSTRHVPAEGSP